METYRGEMRFAYMSREYEVRYMFSVAARDVLVSFGVTWEGRATYEEVESMYLGLLVASGWDGET